jgi:hypothetical protein
MKRRTLEQREYDKKVGDIIAGLLIFAFFILVLYAGLVLWALGK